MVIIFKWASLDVSECKTLHALEICMHVQVHYNQNFQIETVRRTLAPHSINHGLWFAVAVSPSAIVYCHFHSIFCSRQYFVCNEAMHFSCDREVEKEIQYRAFCGSPRKTNESLCSYSFRRRKKTSWNSQIESTTGMAPKNHRKLALGFGHCALHMMAA